MKQVGIVGHGPSVLLLSNLLEKTQVEALLWSPGGVQLGLGPHLREVESPAALADTPLIFFCTQGKLSSKTRALAHELGDQLSGRHVVVHMVRDLELPSGAVAHEVLSDELPTRRLGFLTGPMRPSDIADGKSAAGLCASVFPEVHQLVERALVSPTFRLYRSDDLIGAELAAIYARAITVVMGIARAMNQGASLEAMLFARGLAEAARFVGKVGGKERTVFGLSGAANLMADITEPGSDELEFGKRLVGHGDQISPTERKILAALASVLLERSKKARLNPPILSAATALLVGKMTAKDAAAQLMNLPVLDE